MSSYTRWTPDQPEPDPEQKVYIEAMDFSWRLPWKTVREDAISGLAVVYIEDHENARRD